MQKDKEQCASCGAPKQGRGETENKDGDEASRQTGWHDAGKVHQDGTADCVHPKATSLRVIFGSLMLSGVHCPRLTDYPGTER